MSWQPTTYALISLVGAAVPAVVGSYAWRRRGKPGATALAFMLWVLALWGVLYALELGERDAAAVLRFHEAKAAVLAFAPLHWLIFVLRYTGRERWTKRITVALLAAVPVATLALMWTNEDHKLIWSSEGVRDVGDILAPSFVRGPWFWLDFAYSASLTLAGTALLVLKETARRLKASVREYDIVCRLAGDEFTVILPEITNVRDAVDVANRIVETISRPFLLDNNELSVTTSVGICLCPTDSQDPSTLVKNADAAMYRAKAAGKNRCEVFSGDALQEAERPGLEDDINRAMEENQFVLHYQPEIRIPTSRTVGVEALLRWEHPERGLVYPGEFLPSAETSGLSFVIERWVLREACRQMRSWHGRYPTDVLLTSGVNISSRHFAHPNLAGVVYNVLEETGLPPESLVLEFKESILREDAMSAAVTLGNLKKLGVKLAVDNFGAGYSSLQHLKRFPLDVLKIDTSFVHALDEREEDYEMVSAIISLAHALGLKAVAQGVETPRQLMQLRDMGCEIAQGHYFAGSLSHRATSAFIVADLYY